MTGREQWCMNVGVVIGVLAVLLHGLAFWLLLSVVIVVPAVLRYRAQARARKRVTS